MKQEKARRVLSVEEYLEVSREQAGRAAREVLDKFDFEAAHGALLGANWKFHGARDFLSVEEMREMAGKLVREAMEHGSGYEVQSGPFVVRVSHYDTSAVPYVTLNLVPVFASAVYVDARKIVTKKMIGLSGVKANKDGTSAPDASPTTPSSANRAPSETAAANETA